MKQIVRAEEAQRNDFAIVLGKFNEYCDRIVVSILDKDLSRRLQLITDLTLAQTIQTVCQSEEVATQVSMQGETVSMVRAVVSTSKQPVRGQRRQIPS